MTQKGYQLKNYKLSSIIIIETPKQSSLVLPMSLTTIYTHVTHSNNLQKKFKGIKLVTILSFRNSLLATFPLQAH